MQPDAERLRVSDFVPEYYDDPEPFVHNLGIPDSFADSLAVRNCERVRHAVSYTFPEFLEFRLHCADAFRDDHGERHCVGVKVGAAYALDERNGVSIGIIHEHDESGVYTREL